MIFLNPKLLIKGFEEAENLPSSDTLSQTKEIRRKIA